MMNLWKHLIFVLLCVFSAVSQAAWSVRYQHTDVLGSVIAESNAQGTITQRFGYKPFGEGSPTQKTGVGYTGHLEDTDLGLTYMQQRYYDPVIGRFYSNDPVGAMGHISQGNIQGFNRYNYAFNNPYKYTDPDGRVPLLIPVLVFIAKELVGEIFEQQTGLPAPTVKGASKALAKRFARGRASEARKLNERGIGKNTSKFEGPEGNTIPDGIDPKTGNLVEVKDVKELSNTKQIRNQTAVAEEKGVKLEIDTGVNTKVSKNLEENPTVIIKRHDDLGNGGS